MKNIILIISIMTMLGCDKDNSNPKEVFIDTHFEFSIQDIYDNDLLKPSSINYFPHQGIKVYSFEDGEKKLIDDYTNPNLISSERGIYTILLNTKSSVYDSYSKGEYITLLQLSENIVDTLKIEWESFGGNFYNTRLYYNGQLKWEKDKTELPILITK